MHSAAGSGCGLLPSLQDQEDKQDAFREAPFSEVSHGVGGRGAAGHLNWHRALREGGPGDPAHLSTGNGVSLGNISGPEGSGVAGSRVPWPEDRAGLREPPGVSE